MSTMSISRKIANSLKKNGINAKPTQIRDAVVGEVEFDKSCLKIMKLIEDQVAEGNGSNIYNVIRDAAMSSENPFDYCKNIVVFAVSDDPKDGTTDKWLYPSKEDVEKMVSGICTINTKIQEAIDATLALPLYPFTNGNTIRKAIEQYADEFMPGNAIEIRHALYNIRYNWNLYPIDTAVPNPFYVRIYKSGIRQVEFAKAIMNICNSEFGSKFKSYHKFEKVYNNFPNQFSTGQIGVNALILTASTIEEICMQTTKHYIKFSKLTDKVYDYISEHCEIVSNPILNGKRKMLNCEVRQILNRWPCS